MGYRDSIFQLTTVELTPAYWVKVAPLDKGENDAAIQAATGGAVQANLNASGAQARFNAGDFTDAKLTRGIKEWNLDDETGKVLPISVETVRCLADAHAKKILAALDALTNPLDNPDTVKN